MKHCADRFLPYSERQKTVRDLLIWIVLTIPNYGFAQDQPKVPVVESRVVAGESSDARFTAIDGVLHGAASSPTRTKFLYGVPISEWREGSTSHLKIGSAEIPTSRIDGVKKELPNPDFRGRIVRSEGRWISSPFDGTLEPGSEAMCSRTSDSKQTVYRTNNTQSGDAPVAPRIASFSTLTKLQQSISTDMSALEEYRPWRPNACDVNFTRMGDLIASPEARAYLAAWKEEQSNTLTEISFKLFQSGPSLVDFQTYLLNQFALVEQDLADLPTVKSIRLKSAFHHLTGASSVPPDAASIQKMQDAITNILEVWLAPACRDILYVTSTIPSDPYIFRRDLLSKNQIVMLLRIWRTLASNFSTAAEVEAERYITTSPPSTVEALEKMVATYDSPSQLKEPDRYSPEDLRSFRLLPGFAEESRLAKQTQLSLLTGVLADGVQALPRGDPNRIEFDPRGWRLIVEFHKRRLIKEFNKQFHTEMLMPEVSSQLHFTSLRERIVSNTNLARELGMPAPWPWETPRFRRRASAEGVPGRSGNQEPTRRWSDTEIYDSVLLLSSDHPISDSLWTDTMWFRFLGDMDSIEWAVYDRTVEELLHTVDREISRFQLGPGYTELRNTFDSLKKADDNQAELLFGGEPFWLEECSLNFSSPDLTAGDPIARIRPAYRHLLEVEVPKGDPLLDVLALQSPVSVVLTSLVGQPSEKTLTVSTTSLDNNNAYVARSWAETARFGGRVVSIDMRGDLSELRLELLSTPDQDTIALKDPPSGISSFPGVLATAGELRLPLEGGILGNIHRVTAAIIPRSPFERAKLRSIVEARGF